MFGAIALLTDLYQLTMARGYLESAMSGKLAVFDLYFRRNPFENGFSVAAGLEQALDYIENLRFTPDDIDYLRTLDIFDGAFLEYLETFRFTGDIAAIPEGAVVFPGEPLLRVTAPIIEAQIAETALLNIINHQTLIATKAARVVAAADGRSVLEFGLRRAQGPDAGVYGARAAMIGGCAATSNVLAGKMFGAPVRGTHAHSWVMSFPDELTAFRAYAAAFPEQCTLLADTYSTINSGIPNAITVFREMRERGAALKNYGVRLDSGDLAYLSKKARKALDQADFEDASICASGDLDEFLIQSLRLQGAKIDVWGVGTRLITSDGCPALGGVYKLAAEITDGRAIPKIKTSENPEKITNPGVKKIFRIYDKATGKIKADIIALDDETIDPSAELTIFDQRDTWKRMSIKPGTFSVREPLTPVVAKGERIGDSPSVMEIRDYCRGEIDTLWEEYRRLVNPHILPVDLSPKLYELKSRMIVAANA